jgi:hypothetical protein
MIDPHVIEVIRQKYTLLRPELDERARRLWAAAEATALGYGGVSAVCHATGRARNTIAACIRELSAPDHPSPRRVRRPGGGGKGLTATDPGLAPALDSLVTPSRLSGGVARVPVGWRRS